MLVVCLGWLSDSRPRAQKAVATSWEGTLTVVHIRTAISAGQVTVSGTVTTSWTITLRAKETGRVDVNDRNGKLTGQFVLLADGGSSWTAEISGSINRTVERARGEETTQQTYSGNGTGSAALQRGWIYYSLSDDDPLKNTLPNGAYSLLGDQAQSLSYEIETKVTRPDGTSSTRTATSPAGMPLSFCIGLRQLDVPSATGSAVQGEQIGGSLGALNVPGCDTGTPVINNYMMSGSYSAAGPGDQNTWSATWALQKTLDVKATVTKPDASWRPSFDGSATVTATLDASQGLTGKFRFILYDVSSEPGNATNYGTATDKDLEFAPGQAGFSEPTATSDGWQIEGTATGTSATVQIWSLDYGGWGRLKAEVNVEGKWYTCTADGGGSYVTIPRDDDENRIADQWETDHDVAGQPASADTDANPAGAGTGDGFSNYEEYRGFVVNGEWQDTDPRSKDLFVYDEIGRGTGYFGALGVLVHLIGQNEYDRGSRVVNFDRGYGSAGAQKGLYLHSGSADQCPDRPTAGLVGCVSPEIGTPNAVNDVIIVAEGSAFDSDVAHELGHGVNIFHHGEAVGTCVSKRTGAVVDYVAVSFTGGQWSGDVSCVMRYDHCLVYRSWNTSDKWCYHYPDDTAGTTFCSSAGGTGFNSGPHRIEDGQPLPVAGDAVRGNCRAQVALK